MNLCANPPALSHARTAKDLQQLTKAEQAVSRYILLGLTNKQIAEQLDKAPSTVKAQVSSILHRFGVRTRAELIAAFIDPSLTLSGHDGASLGDVAGVRPLDAGGGSPAALLRRVRG